MKLWRAATYAVSVEDLRRMERGDGTWHKVALRYIWLRETAAQIRWEKTHGVPLERVAWMEAICQWCGETVAHEIEFSPRHADSRQQAIAICHGLVEYHLIDGCEREREGPPGG